MTKKDTEVKLLQQQMEDLGSRFNHHLEIYRNNGKELAAVKINQESLKTNQAWLMRFHFMLTTPVISGIIYIILNMN